MKKNKMSSIYSSSQQGGSLIEFALFAGIAAVLIGGFAYETLFRSSATRSSVEASMGEVFRQSNLLARSEGSGYAWRPDLATQLLNKINIINASGPDFETLIVATLTGAEDDSLQGKTVFTVENHTTLPGNVVPTDFDANVIQQAQFEGLGLGDDLRRSYFFVVYAKEKSQSKPIMKIYPAITDREAGLTATTSDQGIVPANFTGSTDPTLNYPKLYGQGITGTGNQVIPDSTPFYNAHIDEDLVDVVDQEVGEKPKDEIIPVPPILANQDIGGEDILEEGIPSQH